MKTKNTLLPALLLAVFVLVAAILARYFTKSSAPVSTSPLATPTVSNSISWTEGKSLIGGCKVQQTTELSSGFLRLDLTDGTDRSVKPYNQDELYQVVQTVPLRCGFSIIIATE